MILVVATQVQENCGNQNWKTKDGHEYKVPHFDFDRMDLLLDKVAEVSELVTKTTDSYREYVVNWFLADDDYLSDFEKIQLQEQGCF